MTKYRKFIPHLIIIALSLLLILCDTIFSTGLNTQVLYDTLLAQKGIGVKLANQVVSCLDNSNLIRMNIRNPIVETVKLFSLIGIFLTSIYQIKKELYIINAQSFDGHKNTQELLFDTIDRLEVRGGLDGSKNDTEQS